MFLIIFSTYPHPLPPPVVRLTPKAFQLERPWKQFRHPEGSNDFVTFSKGKRAARIVTELGSSEAIITQDINKETRKTFIEQIFKEYDEVQTEIESLDLSSEAIETQTQDRDEIDLKYLDVLSSIQTKIRQTTPPPHTAATANPNAWDILKKRFCNKRLIVHDHIIAITKAPQVIKASHSSLRCFLDTLNSNVAALRQLEVPIDTWHALLVVIIVDKLDGNLAREWQATLTDEQKAVNITVGGIGQISTNIKQAVQVNIKSQYNKFSANLSCFVLEKITENLPLVTINMSAINIPKELQLADPKFLETAPVDLLIGADLFWNLLCQDRKEITLKNHNKLMLQNTHLGFIAGGSLNMNNNNSSSTCSLSLTSVSDILENQMQKFFELEQCSNPSEQKCFSNEEIMCEQHFIQNTCRQTNGKFLVKLPLKNDPPILKSNRDSAVKFFNNLERNLNKRPTLKSDYVQFMRDYISLGHMEEVPGCELNKPNCTYLPHHAVLKDSTSTKLRVVFNASFRSADALSLNDNLMAGPTIQPELFAILLRFRTFKYVVNGDIAKMYRMIEIHPDHSDYQRIVWRENTEDPLKTYRLTTLTYGTKPASFLATRCLKELALQNVNHYPEAAKAIQQDFYVDDLLTGGDSLENLITLRDQIIQILAHGGFLLRKWAANHPALIPDSHEPNLNVSFDKDAYTKTLGLFWNPNHDSLRYQAIMRLIQEVAFNDELACLKQNKPINKKSRLLCLNIFLDKNDNLIRAGGRLQNSSLTYDVKHPIVLPNDHHLIKALVKHVHIEQLHAGVQGTLAALRQNFWIISPRSVVRKILHQCLQCFKVKPSVMYPIMGNLPKSRVEPTRPFSISGVDYAGPIYIKECRGRKNLANKGISWHFIPPRSLHMGGIWEINVKSIKGHLKRTIGEVVLSYEELYTLLTRIEAVLNSRPLCPLSNDPNDLNPITPGHFLIGEPLTSISERDLTTTRINRLTQWQRVEQMRQHFWHRWQREYLVQNINRSKQLRGSGSRPSTPALEVGSMVILVEDNTPPLQWKLGRIVELHPGSDGVVRVVSVKTVNGIFKRATRKVCVLPANE
ncbi:hypothetical protein GEV33_006136 [Tenebrio molitor]|uniref:Integrase catalytic domain-containing protein n=1 Tax=Tenebrio molitor TaxID=7067 RepID=A0A8J6HD76_TENMO|nr:hypothetical protein GEV33_006136 [Tenebrio molitor]